MELVINRRSAMRASPYMLVASTFGASPSDPIGTSNTISIQKALTAVNANGGGAVLIDQPGVYLINGSIKADTSTANYTLNSALVIYSNTTLILADGVTIKLANASNCYTLRNSGGGNTVDATKGVTAANVNITVTGGKWDFNSPNQTNDPRGTKYWWGDGFWFDYVTGLNITDVEADDARKYLMWVTNTTRGRFARLYFPSASSDGLHFGGGCSDVVVSDSKANCADNPFPIIAYEGGYRAAIPDVYLDSPRGACSNFVFENLDVTGSTHAPFRLSGGTGDDITNVVVRNCKGITTAPHALEIFDDTSVSPNIAGAVIRGVVYEGNNITVTTGGYQVYANCNGFRSVTISNTTNPGSTQGLLEVGARSTAWETVTVNGCTDEGAYRGTLNFLGTSSGGQLTVNGGNYTIGTDGRVFQSAGAIAQVTLSGVTVRNTSGAHNSDALIRLDAGANCPSITVNGVNLKGVRAILDTNVAAGTVTSINLTGLSLNGYSASGSYIIHNRDTTSQTYVTGHGNAYTDPANWWDNGVVSAPTGAGYCRVNNPSLQFNGPKVMVNRAAGWLYDVFYNTSTAGTASGGSGGGVTWAAQGAGPVYYNGTDFLKYAR